MRGGQGQELGRSRVGAGERQEQGSSRVGAGQAQSRNKAAAGARRRQSRAGAKAGQEREHARVRSAARQERAGAVQEQDRSTLSFASISPHAIFYGQKQSRSRAGARQDQGTEQGKSKAEAR